MAKVISSTGDKAGKKPGWDEGVVQSAYHLPPLIPNEQATGNPLSQSGVTSFAKGGEVATKEFGDREMARRFKERHGYNFEESRQDKDKGVKEGSKEDIKRDRKEMKMACGGKIK